jgi:hypothetical protein
MVTIIKNIQLPFIFFFCNTISFCSANPTSVGIGVISINYTTNGQEDSTINLYKKPGNNKPFYRFIIHHEDERQRAGKDSRINMLEFMPTPGRMLFRCIDSNKTMYCIVINETTGKICWLKKSALISFSNWLNYFTGCDYIISQEPVRIAPSTDAATAENSGECYNFSVLSIKSEWMEVSRSEYCHMYDLDPQLIEIKGWIRWRKDEKLLVYRGYNE